MKNLLVYYIFILVPILFMVWWVIQHSDNPYLFVLLLLLYALVYHPIIDGVRLRQKNLITKSEAIKLFIPFNNILRDHFLELYFRR